MVSRSSGLQSRSLSARPRADLQCGLLLALQVGRSDIGVIYPRSTEKVDGF